MEIETRLDIPEQAISEALAEITGRPTVFAIEDLAVWYGKSLALAGVTMDIRKNTVTAVIGPSGCGKSTFIRCLNRMSDAVPGIKVEGRIDYHGNNLRGSRIDPVEVRRRIGMVFQRPNPFPKSIYDNIAFALRVLGMKDDLDGRVERALAEGCALGRGQGPAEGIGARSLRRPAAAALHRARDRRRARGHPLRRAVLRARPDLDVGDRGPDARPEA